MGDRFSAFEEAVRQSDLTHQVHLPEGRVLDIEPPPGTAPFTDPGCLNPAAPGLHTGGVRHA